MKTERDYNPAADQPQARHISLLRGPLWRDVQAAIIVTALMLVAANALLIGKSAWMIIVLSDIADPHQRWTARYAPLRDLVVGFWGLSCSLTAGTASVLARQILGPRPNKTDSAGEP